MARSFARLGQAGLFVAATLIGGSAHALTVTTTYVPFSWYATNPQGNSGTGTPAQLTFDSFSSFNITGATLNNVWFKFAGAVNGTGNASASGQARLNNSDGLAEAKLSKFNYSFQALFANGVTLSNTDQSTTSMACVSETTDCTTAAGVVTVPAETSSADTTVSASGTLSGSGSSFGLTTAAQRTMFSTGATVQTLSPGYRGIYSSDVYNTAGDQAAFVNFASPSAFADRFKLSGFVALVYDYSLPPATTPAPLPLLGATAAFGLSRKMRNRIRAVA